MEQQYQLRGGPDRGMDFAVGFGREASWGEENSTWDFKRVFYCRDERHRLP
jgi:hypothetical protein